MEPTITIADLRARHARLVQARQEKQQAFEREDTGFAYVLGELELMIKELEERQAEPTQSAEEESVTDG